MSTQKTVFRVTENSSGTAFGIRSACGVSIPPIFAERQRAQTAADFFNLRELDPVHLKDVIRDYLLDYLQHPAAYPQFLPAL